MTRLLVENARLGYADKVICPGVDLEIPDGQFTVIVGPNACGKSTLPKSLTRLIAPQEGQILLDGQSLHQKPTKEVAREVGLLPQGPVAPDGIRVIDLVSHGATLTEHSPPSVSTRRGLCLSIAESADFKESVTTSSDSTPLVVPSESSFATATNSVGPACSGKMALSTFEPTA
ncbi:ABC transporter ATP-binding protein [Corynebacterium sp.]|uniref:ABC transporter ATP-binding protein n=1 Tax=Corynebacterium sp. TaxID=1720 RepID=UPI0028ABD9F8|nr:ABC transporter ATP-binding protein [Corynebacterium sp.]